MISATIVLSGKESIMKYVIWRVLINEQYSFRGLLLPRTRKAKYTEIFSFNGCVDPDNQGMASDTDKSARFGIMEENES